jgi:hypothetical protein
MLYGECWCDSVYITSLLQGALSHTGVGVARHAVSLNCIVDAVFA